MASMAAYACLGTGRVAVSNSFGWIENGLYGGIPEKLARN